MNECLNVQKEMSRDDGKYGGGCAVNFLNREATMSARDFYPLIGQAAGSVMIYFALVGLMLA
jgi:hypothetical protein